MSSRVGVGGAGGEVGMGGAVAPPTSFGRILRSFGGEGPSSMGEEEDAAAEFPIPPAQRITEVFKLTDISVSLL